MTEFNDLSTLPALLLAALLAASVVFDVRADLTRLVSGRNVVIAGIAAWYLLEALIPSDTLRSYGQQQYNFGVACVGVAFSSFLAGYHGTPGCKVFPALGEQITFFDDGARLWRLVLLGAAIGFAPVIYFTGDQFGEMIQGMLGMRATWGGILGRGRYGDARAAFLMLEMFVGAVAPFAAILLLSRGSTVFQRLLSLIVIIWPLLRAYGSGTRSAMITAIAGVLAVVYWKSAPLRRKQFIIATVACIPILYGLMAAIVVSRGSGHFDWEDRNKADYVGNEMFRELLFISSKCPDTLPYQYGYGYLVQLVNPIPRFLWPGKPTLDAGLLMADLYGAVDSKGEAFLTVSPGLIGEMYMNFGILGIIGLSFFGGWLVKGWDNILVRCPGSLTAAVYYSAGLAVLFIMGRSFTMGMFYGLLSFALLACTMRCLFPDQMSHESSGLQ
jgi:oligosaccharide repeat unit polymerase